ncbi:MAG TPA: MFS transporter, partial [Chloroflexia bacterium]|nr:MFS transporter [Chloroflexia bacterium]
ELGRDEATRCVLMDREPQPPDQTPKTPNAHVDAPEAKHAMLDSPRNALRAATTHIPHLPPLREVPVIRKVIGRSTESAEGLSGEARLHARRNFRLGVLNGIMFSLVEALISPSLVLAYFVSGLGAPNVLIGLLPAILSGGWFLPQILVASRVQGKPRMMGWYRTMGLVRTVCMGLLALVTIGLAGQPSMLLPAFFLLYIIYAFSAGATGIPWLEIVGKVIPPRRRGSFFGLRSFWGGLLALSAAGPIGAILSESLWGLVFPYNFAFLFGLTTLSVGIGVWVWALIKEPVATVAAPEVTIKSLLERGASALSTDRDYRSFMVARVLISLASIADPFYVVFAKTRLSAPPSTVGLYLGSLSAASLLSNFIWSPLADRASNRTVMTLTVVSVAVVPLTALVASLFAGSIDNTVLFTLFAAVFVLSGLALGSARIVNNNMLLSIAPPGERATYVSFLNLILGIVIFVPVLGGALVDLVGFQVLFVLSLLVSAVSLAATLQMSNRRPA